MGIEMRIESSAIGDRRGQPILLCCPSLLSHTQGSSRLVTVLDNM